jgi:hypothetical protein
VIETILPCCLKSVAVSQLISDGVIACILAYTVGVAWVVFAVFMVVMSVWTVRTVKYGNSPAVRLLYLHKSRNRIEILAILQYSSFEKRPDPEIKFQPALTMPGRNVQVHYVHSDILTQSERPM